MTREKNYRNKEVIIARINNYQKSRRKLKNNI